MILHGQDGESVRLVPVGYEFGAEVDIEDWVQVDREITIHRGVWTFRDSALLAWECPLLGRWLTEVAESKVPATGPDDRPPELTFIEPSLAFSVASYNDQMVSLRVHLSHLAAPPWQDIDQKLSTWRYSVELLIGLDELRLAAATWNQEAKAFPPRRSGRP